MFVLTADINVVALYIFLRIYGI